MNPCCWPVCPILQCEPVEQNPELAEPPELVALLQTLPVAVALLHQARAALPHY